MIERLLHDTYFWVLLSFIVFVALIATKGRGAILGLLDSRTAKIKADLDEAARLKSEAQALLADSQRKHHDTLQTAQKIIDAAKESADRLHRETERKLTDSLRRREAALVERIAHAEATAVQELRVQAADLAARAAGKLLQDELSSSSSKLVDDSIKDLSRRLGG